MRRHYIISKMLPVKTFYLTTGNIIPLLSFILYWIRLSADCFYIFRNYYIISCYKAEREEKAGSNKGFREPEGKRWRLICDELGQLVWSRYAHSIYSVAGVFIFSILYFHESEESSLYCRHGSIWLTASTVSALSHFILLCWAQCIPPPCLKSVKGQ